MKKQAYTKPAIRVLKIQQQHIICNSPNGYSGQTLQMHRGGTSNDQIDDEDKVW